MIGGNITATIQIKSSSGKNAIGENVESWNYAGNVLGWLDYSSGQNSINQYDAKVQDTTHFFMCDYFRWKDIKDITQDITSENCRLILNGKIYNVLMIDNPMGLNKHIEIYLKYVGGGLGV